ncbi:hypothetical protein G6L18_04675, partial [Agrobacterium vitis]|nr:hypothetical protein [Agrobacterium vitis]
RAARLNCESYVKALFDSVRPRTLSVETTALLRQIGTMLTEAEPLAPGLRAALD